jgi:tetratricopeptide (TPR) repeat protein
MRNAFVVVGFLGAVASSVVSATDIPRFDTSVDPVCGGLANSFGPYDYRKVTQMERDLVENVHFNDQLRMLDTPRAHTDILIWGEFDYTLRAFPNHPKALGAIDRLSIILKNEKPQRARYTAECYFQRAVKFTPDDSQVRLAYGLYLIKRNRPADAIVQLEAAGTLAPDSRNVAYNLGLAYFKLKDYAKAREYAKRAYDQGYPLPGLRNLLEKEGQWQ